MRMRCFFTCFTSSKSQSKHNKRIHVLNRDVAALAELQLESTALQIPFPQPQEKKLDEEQLNFHLKVLSPEEEAVTDNEQEPSNPTYQALSKQQFDHDDSRNSVEEESSGSLFSLSIDSRRPKCGGGEKVTSFDEASLSPENPASDEGGENEAKKDGGRILVEAESSESLFSLSIDSRKRMSCGGDLGEKEVSSPMPKCSTERNQNQTQSVLTQSKTVKAKFHHQDKENINLQQGNTTNTFSFELLSKKERVYRHEKKLSVKEVAVEISLSSWLIEPETTALPKASANSVGNSVNGGRASSPRSTQSRHVLGALTVKQCPGSTTQTRRNSLSSDDTSNVGTVGSYWRCTGGRVESDSSPCSRRMLENVKKIAEDESKKSNSGPSEEWLDRSLDTVVAKV